MTRIQPALFLLGTLITSSVNLSIACDKCGQSPAICCEMCGEKCCPCEICLRTILAPMRVTETRSKVQIVKTMKEREETYTVFEKVPKKRTYTKECCYLETEVKSKDIVCEQCRRVDLDLTLEDKIKIPVMDVLETTRKREVCTECGKVCIEEPCTCQITRTEEHPRVRDCTRPSFVFENTGKTIDYCVKTPKFEKKECGVETVYELVPVEKKRTVQVCVPEAVKVPCDVQVIRKVSKEVMCCEACWRSMQNSHKDHAPLFKHKDHAPLFKKDKK